MSTSDNPIGTKIMQERAALIADSKQVHSAEQIRAATPSALVANLASVTQSQTAIYISDSIRALPAPTDAEVLSAAMQLPEVRAVIRQAMAAYQMAYNEADRDVETPEEADRIAGLWFGKWMTERYPLSHEAEPHSGDCTKQPWSCLRCHAEEAFASVDASLNEWDRCAALAPFTEAKP
jgi:hypothetical protein